MKTRFISKLSEIKNLKNKFITLDIETFIKDSIWKSIVYLTMMEQRKILIS